MHTCKEIQRIFEHYLAGELKPSELEMLNQHLPDCLDCQALMNMHEELLQMESDVSDPAPEAFQAMRSRVLGQIANGTASTKAPAPTAKYAVAIPAFAAAAMLVLGVFIGTRISEPAALNDELILSTISQQASLDRSLEDSWEAPLFFTNVAVRDWNDERVNLNMDVCRNVDLGTGLNSGLAGDILTQAILNSSSIGQRMQAMEVAALSSEQRLTRALVLALQQDPDQTMRISALNALARKNGDEQVRTAMMRALRDDSSVQVRLLALEQLVGQSVERETLEDLIRQGKGDSNPAVFERARELKTSTTSEEWL
jgi:hypothetical protein